MRRPLVAGLGAVGRVDGGPANGQPEAPILRRTRLRLIAWSGGTTLVVLLVLGITLYAAAASSLAAGGVAQLRARVAEMSVGVAALPGAGPGGPMLTVTSDPAKPGVLIGGAASGTIALVAPATTVGMGRVPAFDAALGDLGLPNGIMAEALRTGTELVREGTIAGTPVRLLAAPFKGGDGSMVAVVIGDRTIELATLHTLLIVLLVGGLAVLAAAIAAGFVYAGRALVPIRESIRRQREFTADASHELRTPLSITRAAIAELRRGRGDPRVVDRAIDDLEAGTGRLEHLVADLLLLARTDAEAIDLVPVDTDLANLAAESAEGLEPVAGAAGIRLALDLAPAPVRGDEARLRQLAGILVDNAIRHSPAGGRVTVTVRPGATLLVQDDGPGIPPDDLERVFERFWRPPGAPPGGTGLGLAIARWIAERHRGSISAENRAPDGSAGAGARFVVRIPA